MQLKLVVTNKASQEVSEALVEVEDKVVIGRQLDSPVPLQGDAISRQHFSIGVQDGQLTAENLSSNGTMLNGVPLQAKEPMPLMTEDILEVPGYEIRVEVQEAGEGADRGDAAAKGMPGWKKVVRAAVRFFDPLEVVLVICAIATLALTAYYFTS